MLLDVFAVLVPDAGAAGRSDVAGICEREERYDGRRPPPVPTGCTESLLAPPPPPPLPNTGCAVLRLPAAAGSMRGDAKSVMALILALLLPPLLLVDWKTELRRGEPMEAILMDRLRPGRISFRVWI